MSDTEADKCPVDSETRLRWLKANPNSTTFPGATKAAAASNPQGDACDSRDINQQLPSQSMPQSSSQSNWFTGWFPPPADSIPKPTSRLQRPPPSQSREQLLATDRVISTIPRVIKDETISSNPSNSEVESGHSTSGNWIYPSEKMFFDAMSRKNHNPSAPDMATVVPIHNAVNERAWSQIKAWEAPYASECGDGPKLESFKGDSRALTPRARMRGWVGYALPFDRHDWAVDRCGKRVDYVIDFYRGKDGGGDMINFYLDVRPKLNSWEGVRMRMYRFVGLV